jgi:hypothetical protein
MTKKTPHLHKYERVILGKNNYTVFRCILPMCSHYIREELASGKMCICNRCESVMQLDAKAMRLRFPHCHSCTAPKQHKYKKRKELHDALADLAAMISVNTDGKAS